MKTIEQLLELSKNPYYKFMPDEKAVLDDFLLRGVDPTSTTPAKRTSNKSSKKTRVTVRNLVEKTIPQPKESGK